MYSIFRCIHDFYVRNLNEDYLSFQDIVTIWIPNMWLFWTLYGLITWPDQTFMIINRHFFWFSDHHLTSEQVDCQTSPVFRWLLYIVLGFPLSFNNFVFKHLVFFLSYCSIACWICNLNKQLWNFNLFLD